MVRGFGEGRIEQWRIPLSMQRAPIPRKRAPRPLCMITRAEWRALPPPELEPGPRLNLPVGHIRYVFTNTPPCENVEECIPFIQQLQKEHMEKGDPDVMYNFLIGSDGVVYEGRGWDYRCVMTKEPFVDANTESISIAYIGPPEYKVPWKMEHTGLAIREWADYHNILGRHWEITPAPYCKEIVELESSPDLPEEGESDSLSPEMSAPLEDSGSVEEIGITLPEGSIQVPSEVEGELDAIQA